MASRVVLVITIPNQQEGGKHASPGQGFPLTQMKWKQHPFLPLTRHCQELHGPLHRMLHSTGCLSRHPLAYSFHTTSLPPLLFSLPHPHTCTMQAPFPARRALGLLATLGHCEQAGGPGDFTLAQSPSLPGRKAERAPWDVWFFPPALFCFQNILIRHFQ